MLATNKQVKEKKRFLKEQEDIKQTPLPPNLSSLPDNKTPKTGEMTKASVSTQTSLHNFTLNAYDVAAKLLSMSDAPKV